MSEVCLKPGKVRYKSQSGSAPPGGGNEFFRFVISDFFRDRHIPSRKSALSTYTHLHSLTI